MLNNTVWQSVESSAATPHNPSGHKHLEVLSDEEEQAETKRKRFSTHPRLLVVADALFEEVGLALQRDHVHPLEGVRHVVLHTMHTRQHVSTPPPHSCTLLQPHPQPTPPPTHTASHTTHPNCYAHCLRRTLPAAHTRH
eukprot:3932685-Rhodomonas_salina.2